MKKLILALTMATLGAAALPIHAQSMASNGMPAAGDALYQALGAKPGLEALMAVFVSALKVDSRIGTLFKETKSAYLQEQLVDQICMVSGGPCVYKGADMKSAHANMEINKAQFNALVEVLQVSMDIRGIPFDTQNKLLERLASMHRDVITVR